MLELQELARRALAWADDDCDAVSAEACREMVALGDVAELRDHFGGRLEFGTAGLRAKVGPGPWRMNRSTVRRASRAVADYLLSDGGHRRVSVIVAFDARESSRMLAAETCGTLAAAGVHVNVFPEPTPTPVAAFAVVHQGADAAIVITASHNPKDYNGFKLYGADGSQIIAPADAEVASRMDAYPSTLAIPTVAYEISATHPDAISGRVAEAYFAALRRLGDKRPRQVSIAYTPLHGLGAPFVERALADAGFGKVSVVASQREPHAAFPTVPFPNPEEPGVMNEVFALAEQCGADVALANDPDVDRLAVGLPSPSGKFIQLTGNQVGVLLADFLLAQHVTRPDSKVPLVVQSVVSTPMLRGIADRYGATYERTLTGFKWISRPAIALGDAVTLVLGFEEAIGYAALPEVRDKDGISAAVVMAELVDSCALQGSNVGQRLFSLYQRHGHWVSAQHNVILPGALGVTRIQTAMAALRAEAWPSLASVAITRITDYATGFESRPTWLGKSNLVELELGELGRVLVRPSGTEPKLKIYVDVRGEAPAEYGRLRTAELQLETLARQLAVDLVARLDLD